MPEQLETTIMIDVDINSVKVRRSATKGEQISRATLSNEHYRLEVAARVQLPNIHATDKHTVSFISEDHECCNCDACSLYGITAM